ncbi:helix-turn-helix domain-containing protein [Streptomyces sulphureus]|uniref:helix-turn-helix domain-containing protein n=1 Tax=Streptomyces sulphureus TaxID=47758 RepID=UPI001FDFFB06|nr:helix-turn-helix transcriptional regulator [Streptomyces sulphureus]
MEARPNVHRRRLGSALRSLRLRSGLNMEEAAERLGLSGKPPLSKIENGKQRVSGLGLTAFLQVYGVEDERTRARMKAMATLAASSRRTTLIDEYKEAIQTHGFEEYLALEGMASKAETYLAQIVPGLLQTREYAASIVERSQAWSTKREVDRFVDLRMARQSALFRDNPLDFCVILDEAALRRTVAGADVMRAQLQHLLDVSEERSSIAIQVLPSAVGAHAGTDGSFRLLHFDAGPPVAVVEALTTSVYLEDDGDVDRYRSAFESLQDDALDVQATRRFIHELIKEC